MFNKPVVSTLLAEGSTVEGKFACKGPCRIAGSMKGKIVTDDLLIIDRKASIKGEIKARYIEIHGLFWGEIRASEGVILAQDAVVDGDIYSPSIEITQGARFNGNAHMEEKVAQVVKPDFQMDKPLVKKLVLPLKAEAFVKPQMIKTRIDKPANPF